MKQIELTQGKFALVDDQDFEELNKFKWHLDKHGRNEYAKRWDYLGFIDGKKTQKGVKMHQHLMKKNRGYIGHTDHIDGNGLNNQMYNLRPTNKSLNSANSVAKGSKYTIYKGISWHKRQEKWNVRIRIMGESYYFGCFESDVEAAKIYDCAARRIYGKNARLNFPKKGEASAIR